MGSDATAIEFLTRLAKELHFHISLLRLSVNDASVNVYAAVSVCEAGFKASTDISIHRDDIISSVLTDCAERLPEEGKVSNSACFRCRNYQSLLTRVVGCRTALYR